MSNISIPRALEELCGQINGGEPVTLVHEPEAWARMGYCFANVKRKIEECGGEGQFGWQFSQMPVGTTSGVLIAVHHEVWKSPEGELIDITPCVGATLRREKGVLFLADSTATLPKPTGFEVGISRPAKFYPLATTTKVRKIVEAARLNERQYWEDVSARFALASSSMPVGCN
jgi:hypothetical protein